MGTLNGVWKLDVPLVVWALRWFFCLFGHESVGPFTLFLVNSLFVFFGCFGLFMIGRISTLFLSLLLFLSCPIVIMSGECECPLCICTQSSCFFFCAVSSPLVHCDHVCEV